jgi:hypothetical protein
MLPTVPREAVDDETRWAEAQSLLDRTPTESAEQRLRRWRQLRILFIATVLVLGAAVGVVLTVLFNGTFKSEASEVPTWQTVMGFSIAGAGLVLQVFGVVTLWRTNRRLRAWSSPLSALTRSQRKELLAQVRGRHPVQSARVPLARLLAEQLANQRTVMTANLGLGILFVGQWIADPTLWRTVIAVAFGAILVGGWPFVQRDARRAQRFLEEHPPATDSGAGA